MLSRFFTRKRSWAAIFFATLCSSPVVVPSAVASPPGGYYKTVQVEGVWWFQAPDGSRFFSRGINVVDIGASKNTYHPDKPEYASFRYYATTQAWADATLKRMHDWNFNTIGGWSHSHVEEGPLPFTVVLGLAEAVGGIWGDLFSPEAAAKFDQVAKEKIVPLRDNPHLLGYFSDNELGWWSGAMFLHFISKPNSLTRQQMIRLLRKRYQDQLTKMQVDFDTGGAKTFDELGHRGKLTVRPGAQGYAAIDEFVQVFAERYYQLAHAAIRRYDPNHLILGDRFAAWYPQSVREQRGLMWT